jgi:hypothetical protein
VQVWVESEAWGWVFLEPLPMLLKSRLSQLALQRQREVRNHASFSSDDWSRYKLIRLPETNTHYLTFAINFIMV